ncbi:hypothetical protein BV25DRAFT_770065 [Artomyces pyxidatus]|uniref:Uncharacterized protein n=1 Tax=Artomyces pyxidatus TaxID=48021 RepID=A0ACB8SCY1_9AGAM|nr:hypothetical protein BV25DRAFT_770065 [Artomyces pyxidatus]
MLININSGQWVGVTYRHIHVASTQSTVRYLRRGLACAKRRGWVGVKWWEMCRFRKCLRVSGAKSHWHAAELYSPATSNIASPCRGLWSTVTTPFHSKASRHTPQITIHQLKGFEEAFEHTSRRRSVCTCSCVRTWQGVASLGATSYASPSLQPTQRI